MNNYYENAQRNIFDENIYTQNENSKIRNNDISEIMDTVYYQRKRTKAKINVYIRKSN